MSHSWGKLWKNRSKPEVFQPQTRLKVFQVLSKIDTCIFSEFLHEVAETDLNFVAPL